MPVHSDTPAAIARVRATRDSIETMAETVLTGAAELVAGLVADEWPRDSGHSARAWDGSGPAVVNSYGYVEFTRDGYVYTLIPRLQRQTEPTVRDDFEALLRRSLGI